MCAAIPYTVVLSMAMHRTTGDTVASLVPSAGEEPVVVVDWFGASNYAKHI